MISVVPILIHFSVRAVGNISEGLKGREITTGIGFIYVVFIYIIGQVRVGSRIEGSRPITIKIPLNQRAKITKKIVAKYGVNIIVI